jgi:hypothetical protein
VAEGEVPALATSSLLERARQKTGLADFGKLGFLGALELLVGSCRHTAELNDTGRKVLPKVLVRHLMNRLYVQDHLRQHPELSQSALPVALVVTGLPRTGTTLLHNLLALDPDHRFLRLWEALHPVPPASDGMHRREALVDHARSWLDGLYALAPGFKAVHPAAAEGPEECDALLQNDFVSQHLEDMFHVEGYSRWLDGARLTGEYEYYSLQLRVLSSSGTSSRPWVLKSPSHLAHLLSLAHVLPTALIVHCHRRPVEAVGSYASLVRTVRRPYSHSLRPHVIGQHALRRCVVSMDRALAARDELGPDRFVDVSYPSLLRDPVGVVDSIYHRLGKTLTVEHEEAMGRWLARNRQHGHGVHRYDLASFGLDADEVQSSFSSYRERFPSVDEDDATPGPS